MKKSITLDILKKNLNHTKLVKLGFKRKKVNGSVVLFTNSRCRFIIKRNTFVNWPSRCSKIAKFVVFPSFQNNGWVIQRRVDTKNGDKAAKIIARKLKVSIGAHDMHEQNCGWLNNKPVCFDIYYEDSD